MVGASTGLLRVRTRVWRRRVALLLFGTARNHSKNIVRPLRVGLYRLRLSLNATFRPLGFPVTRSVPTENSPLRIPAVRLRRKRSGSTSSFPTLTCLMVGFVWHKQRHTLTHGYDAVDALSQTPARYASCVCWFDATPCFCFAMCQTARGNSDDP